MLSVLLVILLLILICVIALFISFIVQNTKGYNIQYGKWSENEELRIKYAFGEIGWAIGKLDDSSKFDDQFLAIADVFEGVREVTKDTLRRDMRTLANQLGISDLVNI